MITVSRTLQVAPSPSVVFAYLEDFTRTQEWDPGTVTTTRSDPPGTALGVGAHFHNVSTYRGRETQLDYVCTVHEQDRHLVFEGRNRTVHAADDLTLAPSATGGTVVTYRARFAFQRWVRYVEPFLRRGFEPIADETVARLTEVLDRLP
ncbi:SRPBCC family protein [Lapillicoccus jejuensis]|uniref:Polyketide cyclase/dehydrase/lipid transport protein n=1 Tax=Lapillicoccus jejuensis TaxID=402171 RepID=A0A542E3P2_9MICO|nr:SRPBCC family protein [Lapillicoccus jejuensis]TQJ09958.1 polyketide cyclase/dehydrase/lipid transport protein [Lapillicoccus jejuensis]